MSTPIIPAARLMTIQPIDHLDPIAQPEPADCPTFDAVVRDLGCPFPRRRDSRGRFVKAGRG